PDSLAIRRPPAIALSGGEVGCAKTQAAPFWRYGHPDRRRLPALLDEPDRNAAQGLVHLRLPHLRPLRIPDLGRLRGVRQVEGLEELRHLRAGRMVVLPVGTRYTGRADPEPRRRARVA